ncbi:MAG: DUF1156 domain-containing protein [Anaerolineaceae bacterium]
MNSNCPRLIEVALPIREISAESVRDKNIHHAHISHLHIWWARRPLAASRAIVFASLLPDPDHPNCPVEFRERVEYLLKNKVPALLKGYRRGRIIKHDPDPYLPYDGIPDTLRNRLLTFIAKWSPEWIAFDRGHSNYQPPISEMLDDRCLCKWETSDPENEQGLEILRVARELIELANGGTTPTILDPFAGGGAIPLEASRLGCQAIANDYNPVAYSILRATCEYPQLFGHPGTRQFGNLENREFNNAEVRSVLVYDFEYWARRILNLVGKRIGNLYPAGSDGKPVLGYLWARTAPCSNPACRAEIPLLRSLLLAKKGNGHQYILEMSTSRKNISFTVSFSSTTNAMEGTMLTRGDVRCPICKQITPVEDLRSAGLEGRMSERMVAVITESTNGKSYRSVESVDELAYMKAQEICNSIEKPSELILPEITGNSSNEEAVSNSTGIRVHLYGMKSWGSLFNPRQLVALNSFIECLKKIYTEMETEIPKREYRDAITLYLGLWIDRIASFGNNVSRWRSSHEKSETPFGGQAIPMIWDYPEVNPLVNSSGTASTQLEYMLKVINHESTSISIPVKVILGDASHLKIDSKSIDVVVTDPPYFNSISYADLSDFFYIWLKRSIGNTFPEVFSTPLTPKGDEATALRHRHGGDERKANKHFTTKLAASFAEAKRINKTDGIITVMFAHQSTEAWTSLIDSLFEAGLTITATYPIETEMKSTQLALNTASLETSITVICRHRETTSVGSFRDVRKEIERVVTDSIRRFWQYGFRGADLIVACYGPAVGVFGKYSRVEKADGQLVDIPTLLETVRQSALKAIAGEFTGDSLSRLYFVWANLYSIGEQSWDDARLVVQVGGEDENAIELARRNGIFIIDGSKCRLALLRDRSDHRHLGEDPTSPLIDQLHQAMRLWKQERRSELVQYLKTNNIAEHEPFWKLAQALFEVLPRGEEDWKLISALLGERETLKQEVRQAEPPKGPEQLSLI